MVLMSYRLLATARVWFVFLVMILMFCFIGLLGALSWTVEQGTDGKMGWDSAGHQCYLCWFKQKNAFSSLVYMPLVYATQYRIHMAKRKSVHSASCSLETSQVFLAHELGEVEATLTDLMEAAQTYFCALYRQPVGTSMENTCFKLFTKKKKTIKIMALPPTSANLLLHVLQAHLQVMLWKAEISRHHLTNH